MLDVEIKKKKPNSRISFPTVVMETPVGCIQGEGIGLYWYGEGHSIVFVSPPVRSGSGNKDSKKSNVRVT